MKLFNNIQTLRRVINSLIDKLVEAEELLEKYEWISVNDRLPEEGIVVIVYGRIYSERKSVDIDYVDKSGNFHYCDKEVTHWMPLPPLPEVNEDE